MVVANFKIQFLKRTAKLNKDATKIFALEILKEFGGLSLLSNVVVSCLAENTFKVTCEKEVLSLVQAAFITCGSYQETKCCFIQIN